MTDRELMKQALEALDTCERSGYAPVRLTREAITALRLAIEQAEKQEPVAWRYKKAGGGWFVSDNEPQYVEQWDDIEEIQPLYTAPQRREWVGLTEEEIDAIWDDYNLDGADVTRAIEAALKEKNA